MVSVVAELVIMRPRYSELGNKMIYASQFEAVPELTATGLTTPAPHDDGGPVSWCLQQLLQLSRPRCPAAAACSAADAGQRPLPGNSPDTSLQPAQREKSDILKLDKRI